jgi:two-component system response regulator PilR (NtrC family)
LGDLPREVSGLSGAPSTGFLTLPEEGCNLDEVVNEVERRLLLQALDRSGGVRTAAARLLGISFRSLRYRLEKHSLDIADLGDEGSERPGEAGEDAK